MEIKKEDILKYTNEDTPLMQLASDYASKQQMVVIDLFMTLERLGISEEDSKRFAKITLTEFVEKCIGDEIDIAKFIFNFVNNLKKI